MPVFSYHLKIDCYILAFEYKMIIEVCIEVSHTHKKAFHLWFEKFLIGRLPGGGAATASDQAA